MNDATKERKEMESRVERYVARGKILGKKVVIEAEVAKPRPSSNLIPRLTLYLYSPKSKKLYRCNVIQIRPFIDGKVVITQKMASKRRNPKRIRTRAILVVDVPMFDYFGYPYFLYDNQLREEIRKRGLKDVFLEIVRQVNELARCAFVVEL